MSDQIEIKIKTSEILGLIIGSNYDIWKNTFNNFDKNKFSVFHQKESDPWRFL